MREFLFFSENFVFFRKNARNLFFFVKIYFFLENPIFLVKIVFFGYFFFFEKIRWGKVKLGGSWGEFGHRWGELGGAGGSWRELVGCDGALVRLW